jgi:hypothetical protein
MTVSTAKLEELISHYQLGEPIKVFDWDRNMMNGKISSGVLYGAFGVSSIIVCIVALSAVLRAVGAGEPLEIGMLLMLLAMLAVSLGITYYFLASAREATQIKEGKAIRLFENGIVNEQDPKKVKVMRYDDIAKIWRLHVSIENASYIDNYYLEQDKNHYWRLDQDIENINELGSFVEQQCFERLYSDAIADVADNKTIDFNVIQLSRKGINYVPKEIRLGQQGRIYYVNVPNKKHQLLAWSHLQGIELKQGELLILKSQTRGYWQRVPIMEISNLAVLMAMCQEMQNWINSEVPHPQS